LYGGNEFKRMIKKAISNRSATYCGGHYSLKSADYVSVAQEVLQLKFIDDFICKSATGSKINIDKKQAGPEMTLPLTIFFKLWKNDPFKFIIIELCY